MRAHLGLGSNQGDRLGALRAARSGLDAHGLRVVASSSLYETAPQGEVLDQADFLNACVAVDTELGPEDLLDVCQAVEGELGRRRDGTRHGPRPIDIDLLLMGGIRHASGRLVLPHPEVTTRRFVLEPLLEIDPSLSLPDGTRLASLLEAVRDQRVAPAGSF